MAGMSQGQLDLQVLGFLSNHNMQHYRIFAPQYVDLAAFGMEHEQASYYITKLSVGIGQCSKAKVITGELG